MLKMSIPLFFGLVVIPSILSCVLIYSVLSQDLSILSYFSYYLVIIAVISIIFGIVTIFYPLRYSPSELVDKNNPSRFISNYQIMKSLFPAYSIISIILLFFQIYNLTENTLLIGFTVAALYSFYFLILMVISMIIILIVHFNLDYIFVVSRVYCMMASKNKKEEYQLRYLIKSIESYNIILKKYAKITLNINKHIITKFADIESKTIFIEQLLSEFKKTDENKILAPMKYLLKEFDHDLKTLKQYTIQDQIIKLSPILILTMSLVSNFLLYSNQIIRLYTSSLI